MIKNLQFLSRYYYEQYAECIKICHQNEIYDKKQCDIFYKQYVKYENKLMPNKNGNDKNDYNSGKK